MGSFRMKKEKAIVIPRPHWVNYRCTACWRFVDMKCDNHPDAPILQYDTWVRLRSDEI